METPTPESQAETVPGYWSEAAKPPEYGRAVVYGLGAAVAGAVAWYAITYVSGWELGLVAVGVGWLVGVAVYAGAGRRGDRTLQWIAALLGGVGIIVGYYLVLRHNLRDVVHSMGAPDLPEWALATLMVELIIEDPGILFPWAALFTGIGIWEAWKGARGQGAQAQSQN